MPVGMHIIIPGCAAEPQCPYICPGSRAAACRPWPAERTQHKGLTKGWRESSVAWFAAGYGLKSGRQAGSGLASTQGRAWQAGRHEPRVSPLLRAAGRLGSMPAPSAAGPATTRNNDTNSSAMAHRKQRQRAASCTSSWPCAAGLEAALLAAAAAQQAPWPLLHVPRRVPPGPRQLLRGGPETLLPRASLRQQAASGAAKLYSSSPARGDELRASEGRLACQKWRLAIRLSSASPSSGRILNTCRQHQPFGLPGQQGDSHRAVGR